MAVEAQRLIAVSLGKIASARGRRTGVDLHKNLLVSSVLQRAKNAFIIETYKATVQAKTEAAKAEKKAAAAQAVSKEAVVNSRPLESMDTENHSPESDVSPQQKEEFSCTENKENDPSVTNENGHTLMECNWKVDKPSCDKSRPSCDVLEPKNMNTQNQDNSTSSSCGGCVNKRRHSELDEDTNSSKRAKYENNTPTALGGKKSQDSQISSLVNIFNSGFSGLTNVGQQNAHIKGQGYSSDSPATNSCATAVANGFTKLAGPIIAMAMTV